MRNLVITGLSLFLGISIPQFFDEYWVPRPGLVHTNAGWVSIFHFITPRKISVILFLNFDFIPFNSATLDSITSVFLVNNQIFFVSNSTPVVLQFNAFLNTIFMSPPTVALIVAVFLDNTIDVEKSKVDRGMPWWVKFRTFRGDNRNEEFYTLPFNLNRYFPPT